MLLTVRKNAREISTFDFITSYTNLPNEDCILHKLIKFFFNVRCKEQKGYRKYLTVMKTDCVWSKKKCGFNSYTMYKAKIMLNYLIK